MARCTARAATSFLDLLGVGGDRKLHLPNRTVQAGGFVEGTITLEPGERDRPIIALKKCSRRDNAELV